MLAALLLLLTSSGCSRVTVVERGSLVAYAERLDESQERSFYAIAVGRRGPIDARALQARVRLGDEGPWVALGELSPELVAQFVPAFEPPAEWPVSWRERALHTDSYEADGLHFDFDEGELVFVGICSDCAGGPYAPAVGTPDGQRVYTLPLTRAQLEDVFGAAERVHGASEVRF